jgi:hypothetical protein
MNGRTRRILTAAAIAAGALAPGVWYALAALYNRTAERTAAELQGELQQARRRTAELLAAPAPGGETPAVPWRLGAAPEVAAILHELQLLGRAAGVAFDSVSAVHGATPGRQAFEITGTGTLAALCTALAAIEGHPRLLVIESMRAAADEHAQVRFSVRVVHHFKNAEAR